MLFSSNITIAVLSGVPYHVLIEVNQTKANGDAKTTYQRSQIIEDRLRDLLKLIHSGGHSTPILSQKLGISQPTVSRCLAALRERGYTIRSVKDNHGWSYEIMSEPALSKGTAR